MSPERNRCTIPRKRGWEGSNALAVTESVMRSCVRAIQASTGLVQSGQVRPQHTATAVTVPYCPKSIMATVLAGEWLGSRADEGRAKLR